MRRVAMVLLVILMTGCHRSGPTLAGSKPVNHWVQALGDEDPKVRKTAVMKLGNVGSADPGALPALCSALKDPDAEIRCEVILAIVKFGPEAKVAVPALTELRQNDPDAKVRSYAGRALERF